MAVVEAIPPHRKSELHARLLAVLEDDGGADPAVLAHHAEGAGNAAAIRRHALAAARRSRELGAHREAAVQFELALRYADPADRQTLAELHEGVAAEYLLLDRLDDSEAGYAKRCVTGASWVMTCALARIWATCPTCCFTSAAGRRAREPLRRGSRSCNRCLQGQNWPWLSST